MSNETHTLRHGDQETCHSAAVESSYSGLHSLLLCWNCMTHSVSEFLLSKSNLLSLVLCFSSFSVYSLFYGLRPGLVLDRGHKYRTKNLCITYN